MGKTKLHAFLYGIGTIFWKMKYQSISIKDQLRIIFYSQVKRTSRSDALKGKKMKLKSLVLALVAAGVTSIGFAAPQVAYQAAGVQEKASAQMDRTAPIGPATAPNYRAIVERFGPTVVGVYVEGTTKTIAPRRLDVKPDDPFFKFFGGIPGNGLQMPNNGAPTHGLGSGFIVRKDGLILTNAHVVKDADEVMVKLSDRREFKAKVLGSDPATDIAVIKIDANNLPVVNLGDSSNLNVGDYVLAIGSPFGFEQSATAGIVSAKGRSLPGDGYVPFIQTDAAVNPGNSGGPLFDATGKVVGITSQIYSESGGYQGLSFAIPIDVALRVEDQITSTGKVVHARLGVTIQQLSQSLAESFKLKRPDGALVSDVSTGSAAAKAGIKAGDVILSYNAQPILASTDLPALVSVAKPGDRATVEVWRGGRKLDLAVTLAEAKGTNSEGGMLGGAQHERLGVGVRPLTPDEKRESNLASGVVVEQVAGSAAKAGIEPGDIILAINGATVTSVEELHEMVSQDGNQLAVLVQRGEEKIFIPVKLS
jgi:serine protease Do